MVMTRERLILFQVPVALFEPCCAISYVFNSTTPAPHHVAPTHYKIPHAQKHEPTNTPQQEANTKQKL